MIWTLEWVGSLWQADLSKGGLLMSKESLVNRTFG